MTYIKNKVVVFCTLLFAGAVLCMINSPWILMGFAILLFVLIFIKAKYSFFMVFSFIMLFSYMQVIIYRTTGLCAGMLSLVGKTQPFYFKEMSIAIISYFLIALFFVWFTNLVENEKKIYEQGPNINLVTAVLFLAVSVILIILVFPSLPTFKLDASARRTQGFSGTYGFVLLSLVLSALTIDTSFKHKFFIAGYVFVAFWIFGHAERVEVLGFLIYYMLKLLNHYDGQEIRDKLSKHKKVIIILMAGSVFLFCVWIGLTRNQDVDVTFSLLMGKLLLQGTCGDVLYIFNCAIDMWKNGNLLHGYTYIDYLLQLIPGATLQYSAGTVITNFYFTVGGAFFFVEPVMNFGLIGAVWSNVQFYLVMYFVTRKSTSLRAYIWIPIVTEIFRTMWYGRSGWILAVFIEMPLLYLGVKFTLSKVKLRI